MEVLINSNFNCGFNIKRDVLYKILKYEYNIPTIYDPCMYPGIQCKYNYEIKNGSTLVMRSSSFSAYPSSTVSSMTPNGIDFPNGITVSTLANIGGAAGLSRARMTIFYILK